jgi:flavorubredoxin
MASGMDISMIVPQHGRALVGKAVPEFIRWVSELQCGIDPVTQANYRIP